MRLPPEPVLDAWVARVPREPVRTIDFLVALNQRVLQEVAYLIRMEPGVQTPQETLPKGSGSCSDSALLPVPVVRRRGLAAGLVSGCPCALGPAGEKVDQR